MSRLKCFLTGPYKDYRGQTHYGKVIFATSKEQAAWLAKLYCFAHLEYDSRLSLERRHEFDKMAVGNAPYIEGNFCDLDLEQRLDAKGGINEKALQGSV